MSIIQALIGSFSNVLGAVYRVLHSLRFEYSQGDYLTKTLGTPTTSNVWTWSGWVKLNSYTYNNYLFSAGNNTTDEGYIYIHGATKEVRVASRDGGTLNVQRYTQALTQDPGEWIHIVVQGSSNSAEVWINGQQQTSWNTNTTNSTSWSINSAVNHGIGVRVGQSGTGPYLDGQMAEVHFIDGTAYDASYFGATRGGQWVPKEVTGLTYGTNGFYLPFDRREEGVTLLLDGSSPTNDISSNDQDASLSFKGTAFSASTRTGPGSQGTRDVIDFNGSDQFIVSSYYTSDLYNQNFTIEGWYDIDVLSGTHTFWAHRNDAAYTEGVQVYCNSSEYGFVVGNSSSWIISGATGGTPSTGWHHIALTRSGNNYTLYVDGVSTVSASSSGTVVASGGLSIGSGADTTAGTQWLDGAVMDFRVTEGIARDIAAEWTAGTYTSALTNDIQYGSLGRDASTNGNDFTVPTNTLTPDDQLIDSPNLRFATWDTASVAVTLSEGNLKTTHGASDEAIAGESSALVGGKFYCELYWATGTNLMPQVRAAAAASEYSGYFNDGTKNGVESGAYGSSYGVGSIIGCAVDASTSKVWWRLDGTWQDSGDPASGTNPATSSGFTGNPPLFFALSDGGGADTGDTSIANFGQDHTFAGAKSPLASPFTDDDGNGEFYYQPPTGFKALVTSY